MSRTLPLDLLACPACRAALREEGGGLRCTACPERFERPDGVPELIPSAVRTRMRDGGDPAWSRWNEALRGLEAWRSRRQARAHQGVLPSDGTQDRSTRELFERAGAAGVVVDVGAKDGSKRRLLPESARYVGVDPYAAPRPDLPGESTLVRGVAETLPVRDGAADAVISLAAFDYFVDGAAAVDEWARVLRPGGGLGLLVSVVAPRVARARNADSRAGRAALALGALPDVGPTGVADLVFGALVHRERVHTHYYTQERVEALVARRFEVTWSRAEPQAASTILYVAGRKRG
jgi:SAM-dependent methyltransferase